MSEEELQERLANEKKVDLIELLRTFKKEGIKNFVVLRQDTFNGLLDLYKQEKEERKKAEHNYDELTKTTGKLEIELEREKNLNNETEIALNNRIFDLEYELNKEKEKNKQWEDKIREKIKAYENKCAVLRKDSSTFQWYEMGKNVGSANALQELLEE